MLRIMVIHSGGFTTLFIIEEYVCKHLKHLVSYLALYNHFVELE